MTPRAAELARLTTVYAQRRSGGVEDRYAPYTPANLFRLQSLERAVAADLRRVGLLPWPGGRALDVGCGGGWWLQTLTRWGVPHTAVHGLDALPTAVRAARGVHPALVTLQGAADGLPFADASFDLVSQFTVFSSILDAAMRRAAAREMVRVLRPGGAVLWYDFTANPTNRDTHGITATEAASLFAGCPTRWRRVTLAPPLARLLVPRAPLLAEILERVPLLCSHIVMSARRPPSRAIEPSWVNHR